MCSESRWSLVKVVLQNHGGQTPDLVLCLDKQWNIFSSYSCCYHSIWACMGASVHMTSGCVCVTYTTAGGLWKIYHQPMESFFLPRPWTPVAKVYRKSLKCCDSGAPDFLGVGTWTRSSFSSSLPAFGCIVFVSSSTRWYRMEVAAFKATTHTTSKLSLPSVTSYTLRMVFLPGDSLELEGHRRQLETLANLRARHPPQPPFLIIFRLSKSHTSRTIFALSLKGQQALLLTHEALCLWTL